MPTSYNVKTAGEVTAATSIAQTDFVMASIGGALVRVPVETTTGTVGAFSDLASLTSVSVGDTVRLRSTGTIYTRALDAATDAHLDYSGGAGVKWYLASGTRTITPAMFGIVGVTSVGDIDLVGTASIPDETTQIQKMFDFALLHGCEIDMGETDRDYGVSATIVIDPQAARNQGNINAVVTAGDPLQLHFSNTPSVVVRNPGNSRIVALSVMAAMFRIDNLAAVSSTAPYWTEWHGLNLHGNALAVDAFATTYSYRNLYSRCKIYGFENGWQSINDAGSRWEDNEINCTESAIYLDNAGDCTVSGGDISVQKDGILFGGGNNVRVDNVTFTGNVFVELELVGVRLFGGSTVTADFRSRGVHISGCEGAGLDYLVYGDDSDADGKKEIFNITLGDNHIVRTTDKPNIKMIYVKNGFGITLEGNSHGDLLNAVGVGPSVELESCETVMINDNFHNIAGNTILLNSCQGGSIKSVFSECAVTSAEPVIQLQNSTEIVAVGNAARWRTASPTVTAFIEETGTSNRNRAANNAIDTTASKLPRPYIRLGAQSALEHTYFGTTTFNPGTVTSGSGGTSTGIAVTGARLGDILSLGFSGNTLGLQFDAYVTASDLVNVSYKNETGGDQTPASMTMTIEARSR